MNASVIRLALVDPNDTTRAAVKNLLLGIDMVWLEAECSRYEFFVDVAQQTSPDIALICIDSDPVNGLALVAKISQSIPTCNILVVSNSQEGSLILQAMRNGAKEFLNSPLKLDDFLAALDRIHHSIRIKAGDGEIRSSQIVSICGSSGGIGCTALAVNMACILAQNEKNSVVLMDLDFALGDADVWLDIIPDYTIQDVADNISRLDYSLLKRSLSQHDCGVYLLPRPVDTEMSIPITPDDLSRVISLLKATFTHLIIDVSKAYTPIDVAAMSSSDNILLTTQLDLPSLRNVVRLTQFFDQNERLADKFKIVVNRLGLENKQISINKALETIGKEVFWQIPNEYATMVESRNNGVPLILEAPKSKLTKSVKDLSEAIDGTKRTDADLHDEANSKKKSLFSFLSKPQT